MTKGTHTSVRFSDETRRKLDALLDEGHSSTLAGVLEIAIDRMYQEELRYKRVRKINKPFSVVFSKD